MTTPTENQAIVILIHDRENSYAEKYFAIAVRWIEESSYFTKINETVYVTRFPDAFGILTKIAIFLHELDEKWIHLLVVPCASQGYGVLPEPLKKALLGFGLSVLCAEYPEKQRAHR